MYHEDSKSFLLFGKQLNQIIAILQMMSDKNPNIQALNEFIQYLKDLNSYEDLLNGFIYGDQETIPDEIRPIGHSAFVKLLDTANTKEVLSFAKNVFRSTRSAGVFDITTNKLLTRDTSLAASLSYDPTTVEVLLSSAIDAVGANAPNKVLTTAMVGHLPITGTIQSR